MCGIFGYIGKEDDAATKVFAGLKLLEYRGYDSWGIAVQVPAKKEIEIEKHVGKIGDSSVSLPKSSIGIGHTRWATHGGVTVENAHPHFDCTKKIAVLHNGIIENFQTLKKDLQEKGHKFISETDTEVVPHLIEEFLKIENFATAVRKTFLLLTGMNAIVAISSDNNEIIAAKSGSPMVIGIGNNENYVASDVSGIVKHTRKVIFLEDNQMAVLSDEVKILQISDGIELQPKINNIDWKFDPTDKGHYKHFLLKEIHEQPTVITNIAMNFDEQINEFAHLIKNAYGTFMLGCGTASYAAIAGTYLFSSIAKKHVNFSIGSEFNYLEDYLTSKSLVIPISQSGETIDVIESVGNAKKHGAKIAAVTNVLGSSLYRMADYKILLGAGSEIAVVSTKAFTAMFAVLLLTAYKLAGKYEDGEKLLLSSAEDVSNLLNDKNVEKIYEIAKIIKNVEHVYILGRGLSYAAALEASLKLKETSYIHAEGFAGGELKHGVIALVEKGTPCIVLAPNDNTYDAIISNAQEVKARGAMVIGIGPKNNEVFDHFLSTADIKEATLISQIVISQLLAYHLALLRGIKDPDKPRNLAKSVVVK